MVFYFDVIQSIAVELFPDILFRILLLLFEMDLIGIIFDIFVRLSNSDMR